MRGEQGIGKTRLAFEFAHRVSSEATVLLGRCDREALLPFAPFVEAMSWLFQTWPAQSLRDMLGAIEGSAELVQLVPGLAASFPAARELVASTPDGRRYRMFEAFTRLLHAVSGSRPILLLIEDMHWADRSSMLLLRHLIRSPHQAAICVIVTCSDADALAPAEEMLADLRREPSSTQVLVGGLPESDIRCFVDGWTGQSAPPHLIRLIGESTRGNPFFLTEMLRHLSETNAMTRLASLGPSAAAADLGVPGNVRELIEWRLSHLSKPCNRLLTVAAVVGREFDLPLAAALAEQPDHVVLEGIEEAVAARIVQEAAGTVGRFSFTHAVVRETLYDRQTAARRVRLHHRVAELIENQCQPGKAPLAELAYHFRHAAAAGQGSKALDYAVRAAEHAAVGLALDEAARHYGTALQALEFLPQDSKLDRTRFGLHARRGRTLFQVGQWALARLDFEAGLRVLEASEAEDMEMERCELLVSLAETCFWLMDVTGVRQFAGQAQRLAERVGRDDLWANALAWTASAEVADGHVLEAIDMDCRALTRMGGIRSFALARSPLTLYWAGRTKEAVEQAAQAVEHARQSGDPAFLLYALQHWGLSLSAAGRYGEAFRVFDEACTFGRSCGALPMLSRAMSMSVAPPLGLGNLEGAAARALEARELAHRVSFKPPLVSTGIDLLLISARSHDPGSSEGLLKETALAAAKASGWHAWKWRLRLSQARAELALARGKWSEAVVAAGSVVEQSRTHSRVKYEALGLATRARALGRLGSRQAVEDAHAAMEVARVLADPAVLLDCGVVLLDLDGSTSVRLEVEQIHLVRK